MDEIDVISRRATFILMNGEKKEYRGYLYSLCLIKKIKSLLENMDG